MLAFKRNAWTGGILNIFVLENESPSYHYLSEYMKRRIGLLLLLFLSLRLMAQDARRDSLNSMSYLSNSQIKVRTQELKN